MRRLSVSLAVVSFLVKAAIVTMGRSTTAQEATPVSPPAGCPTTTEDENAAIARRWHEEAINHHDLTVLDEILAPDAGGRHADAVTKSVGLV
jgi:hypothetical protein